VIVTNQQDKTEQNNEIDPVAPEVETVETAEDLVAGRIAELEAALQQAQAAAAEYLDGWQRARAEFANYRKRIEREREEITQETQAVILTRLLPVIDDLSRATENTPGDLAGHNWTQGVQLIGEKFSALLQNNGLEEIDPAGEAFDPTRHEAVGVDENATVDSGHITVVLQKGYAYKDKVLRPAMVRIAR
jgi:molecular chaperone GrpE